MADPRTLTYHEVLAAGRRAVRRGEKDEFVHLPEGITFWRSLDPRGPRTYCCSLPVQDRTLPADGWVHERSCDCPYCSAEQAPATGGGSSGGRGASPSRQQTASRHRGPGGC